MPKNIKVKREEAAKRQEAYDKLSLDEKLKHAGKKETKKILAKKENVK
jgi:hypothetical protein